MHDEFSEMACQELENALSNIPQDPIQKVLIFNETVRALDYWTVFQRVLPNDNRLTVQDFDLIQWGWNLSAEHLLSSVEIQGAFPIIRTTRETSSFALDLLLRFGRTVLLQRASDMIRYGFLTAESTGNKITLRMSGPATDQFLDRLEFSRLSEIEEVVNKSEQKSVFGWQLVETDNLSSVLKEPGAFLGRTFKSPMDDFVLDDINKLMLPLIFPWDSGNGIMMGYSALPEIDDHFLAAAMKSVLQDREEAGIHPDAKVGNIRGADLATIVAVLTSLHLKHIRFALLAPTKHPEISLPQSLTIWGPFEELVNSIADYAPISKDLVRCCLEAITLQPSDTQYLRRFTTPFVPLLISLGNGLILRPVSSLNRNPFMSIRSLLEWRDPGVTFGISAPQEGWLRSDLYNLFQGNRYLKVEGNIKIRERKKIVTDIDAAIFDITTGELALFQLKWQDFHTNDVRKLRSKASNLAKELDAWAEKVGNWIENQDITRLVTSLRLNLPFGVSISSIFLFGISRDAARTGGYGFPSTNKRIAIANWAQFRRIRMEIGPSERVFRDLYISLRSKTDNKLKTAPLPVTIEVSGKSITFEDLWNEF